MPRGQLTAEQRERQIAAIRAKRADPEFEARRLAALRSPETRAKQRAAKLGKPQSPELIAKRMAPRIGRPLTPEHRAKVSAAQKGRPLRTEHRLAVAAGHRTPEARANMRRAQERVGFTPAKRAALASWNAQPRPNPMPEYHREALAAGQARAYAEGRRTYSTLERRASWLLLPLGFRPWVRINGHVFDFASADDRVVVEVNGCRWHDHRPFKPSCPTTPRPGVFASDETYRAIARARRMKLIELWSCDEANWPKLIGVPGL